MSLSKVWVPSVQVLAKQLQTDAVQRDVQTKPAEGVPLAIGEKQGHTTDPKAQERTSYNVWAEGQELTIPGTGKKAQFHVGKCGKGPQTAMDNLECSMEAILLMSWRYVSS
jgi:hypothetical protein